MTYGVEAVIPLETNFLTLKTSSFCPNGNNELLERSLDLIEKKRERATVQLAYYQHKLKQGYDAKVKLSPLAPGNLVLRKVLSTAKNPAWGKVWTKLGRAILYHFGGRYKGLLSRGFG